MSSILARLRRLEQEQPAPSPAPSAPSDKTGTVTIIADEYTAEGSQTQGSQNSDAASNHGAEVRASSGNMCNNEQGASLSDGWISADRSPKRLATLPKMHNIVCKKVPLSHLVWAPCYYFKVRRCMLTFSLLSPKTISIDIS
jgi:hypothetical protein